MDEVFLDAQEQQDAEVLAAVLPLDYVPMGPPGGVAGRPRGRLNAARNLLPARTSGRFRVSGADLASLPYTGRRI